MLINILFFSNEDGLRDQACDNLLGTALNGQESDDISCIITK